MYIFSTISLLVFNKLNIWFWFQLSWTRNSNQSSNNLPSLSRMAQKVTPIVPPVLSSKLMTLSLSPTTLLEKTMPPPPAPKPRNSVHRSPSPPHPLIAAPLLEMGFSLKHVQKALNAIGGKFFWIIVVCLSCGFEGKVLNLISRPVYRKLKYALIFRQICCSF